MAFTHKSRPAVRGQQSPEAPACPCCGQRANEALAEEHAAEPPARTPGVESAAPVQPVGPRIVKVGVGRIKPCNASAEAVMASAAAVGARTGTRPQPILRRAAAPSLAQTLGNAPLPSEEFVAACESVGLVRPPVSSRPAPRPAAPAVVEPVDEYQLDETADWPEEPASVTIEEAARERPWLASRTTPPHEREMSLGLAWLVKVWPELPPRVQATILSMVNEHVR